MKKSAVVLLHLGYWFIYFSLLAFIILLLLIPQQKALGDMHFAMPLSFFMAFAFVPGLLAFYSFYTFLFRKYFLTKKIFMLFIIGIFISVSCGVIGSFDLEILSMYYNSKGKSINEDNLLPIFVFISSFVALLNGIIGLVMKGFISSYNDITLKEELNKKNYEMELALVKNQINPHFLFNTINNIDVLIQKEPAKASDYLNKLSDIMRFMLYETKADTISLSTELTYIEKYIDLQKIRSSNSSYVNYSIEGNPDGIMIAPMLFIPFLENAFKHTTNKNIENAIIIKITIHKEMIIFDCENKYITTAQQASDQNGLGNDLIEKRLQLLYPKSHQLQITAENNIYKVTLSLTNNVH